ncbi:transglutaminase family protein [Sutterella sp.]|uniref:transglutaminase family protein n=1 Tax=Sutterella sp. TaxID=1981025 RepID=UPI0026E0FE56|nr:transglutaminase family protein [Sutterella sp.]MDO5531167.1 transglutaminase family protein [Sutterella sp.]
MKVAFSLETTYTFEPAAEGHVFRLRASPPSCNRQRVISASLTVSPAAFCAELVEPPFGNRVFTGRIDDEHSTFHFHSKGLALVLPDRYDTVHGPGWLAYPSMLTRPGETLEALSKTLGSLPDDIELQIDRILACAHGALTYESGSTSTATTAEEALRSGRGVCQDYAHVMLALLRMRRISCRYVAGLVAGTGETHAWIEAWTGERWLPLDPTEGKACGDTYLALARGADFTQAAIERGVFSRVRMQAIRTTASLIPVESVFSRR